MLAIESCPAHRRPARRPRQVLAVRQHRAVIAEGVIQLLLLKFDGSPEVGALEVGFPEEGVFEFRPLKEGALEVGSPEEGAFEVRPEGGALEVRPLEVGAFEVGYRYLLRADIVQHFASVDHAILLDILRRRVPEGDVMRLVDTIVASGRGVLDDEYRYVRFPGDDLLAICRPRGLPIGNLTSQFWSNCYLHPFDQFVTRELGCPAYLRYVDDFALFGDDKRQLWTWKAAIIERLAPLRLVIHESRAQVLSVGAGIPWLGFVVHPTHRLVEARKVRSAYRRLRSRLDEYHEGEISYAELDASIQGWINHVHHADSWGLRRDVLETLPIRPAEHRRAMAARHDKRP